MYRNLNTIYAIQFNHAADIESCQQVAGGDSSPCCVVEIGNLKFEFVEKNGLLASLATNEKHGGR